MKATKVTYWVTTTLLFLMEGLMPALTSQTEMGKEAISHLGYPAYFGVALAVFKVLGALVLIIPKIPTKMKDWAYGCFAIEFLFAAVSHVAVDGIIGETFIPLIAVAVLMLSYTSYHKLQQQ
ncbi:MAG: hypothetical protein RL762_1769 [Bacteroidota bacterium]|jgi:hypothetical protein